MHIGVALVEPQHHINVGYVARIMKNFGFYQLYLVEPRYDQKEAARFAMHGRDILTSAKLTTLKQLRNKFHCLIGTSALLGSSRSNIVRDTINSVQLAKLICSIPIEKDYCIVLGREASGLKNNELEMCDIVVVIDTGTSYRTMNISHALAILLYEIKKQQRMSQLVLEGQSNYIAAQMSTREEKNLLISYVKKTAECCGYDMYKRQMLYLAVKRILARGIPTSKEVMLIVSLFRKCILAIERQEKFGACHCSR
jgi:tRNA/rRNA methyltransferase